MKKILILLSATLVVSCAAPVAKVSLSDISESNSIILSDLRPKLEKQSDVFSYIITSKAYGIYRRGDDLLNPTSIRLFQHRVYEKFKDTGMPNEITVYHLVVYMNLKSQLRRGGFGAVLGGAIGASISAVTNDNTVNGIFSMVNRSEFDSLNKDEYKRALYTKEENPKKASVFVVYLDAEVDGKRAFIKSITPYNIPDGENSHLAAVETAIEYFLKNINQKSALNNE